MANASFAAKLSTTMLFLTAVSGVANYFARDASATAGSGEPNRDVIVQGARALFSTDIEQGKSDAAVNDFAVNFVPRLTDSFGATTFNTRIRSTANGETGGAYYWNAISTLLLNATAPAHHPMPDMVAHYHQAVRFAPTPGQSGNPVNLETATFELIDHSGPLPASSASATVEINQAAYGPDPNSKRTLLTLVGSNSDPQLDRRTEFNSGINASAADPQVVFKQFIAVGVHYSQAILDTRYSTQLLGAHAIWLADDQSVAFDAAGRFTLRFRMQEQRLVFAADGKDIFSIDSAGNLRTRGSIMVHSLP